MAWILVGNLKGPTGPQGPQGEPGIASPLALSNDAAFASAIATLGTSATKTALINREWDLDIRDFGGIGDGRMVPAVAIANASATLTSATSVFAATDVGKIITVFGAGVAGGNLSTTIAAYTSATVVTLSTTAGTTVTAAVANFGTDNNAAINAAIVAAFPGKKIRLPSKGSGSFYQCSGGITIDSTRPSISFLGNPRDAYNTSIRCFVTNATIITIKAAGVVFQDIGFVGDSTDTNGGNGVGATVTALDFYGDINGNIDSATRGVTFQGLALGARVRARNAIFEQSCLFSNCLAGITFDGIAAYHTGPSAVDQNRGNTVQNCKFHNIGVNDTTASILYTNTSKVLHSIVQNNNFDSSGFAKSIRASGTLTNPVSGLFVIGNRHTEMSSDTYDFTYVRNSQVHDFAITGFTISANTGRGVVLTNCTNVEFVGFTMTDLRGSGVVSAGGNNNIRFRTGHMNGLGIDVSVVGHGFDLSSTDVDVMIDDVSAISGDGWYLTGSPTGALTGMRGGKWSGFTLGGLNSDTIVNHSSRGTNTYSEGRKGRIEDTGFQQYNLVAATPKAIATATAGGSFGSFFLDIEVTGRHSGSTTAYAIARRVVTPENNTAAVISVIGTDATSNMTLTVAMSSAQGVTVTVQTSVATFVGAKIRASAGGGASDANSRQVTVVMAAP